MPDWRGVLVLALAGCGGAVVAAPEPAAVESGEEVELVASLRMEQAEDDEAGMPRTRITLALLGDAHPRAELHPVAVATGACTSRAAEAGELLRVHCWWAGAGATFIARLEGQEIVVTRVDEEEGHPDLPPPHPPAPREVARVALPEGASVRPIR